jgi:uncharacterized protein YozE (UPF0346 family)
MIMVRGKCNCGKKATSEWMTYHKPKKNEKYGSCNTLVFCDKCKPKTERQDFFCIYGKK